MAANRKTSAGPKGLEKCPSGISGLDEITGGGLPKGRPTLVVGSAGSGKTLMAMEFLVTAPRSSTSRASSSPSRKRPRNWRRTSPRWALTSRAWSRRRNSPSTTSTSSAARSRRRASTTWKGCSSGWATRSTASGAKRVVLDTIEALFAGSAESGHPARRTAPPVPLAEGQGRHGRHHRRARREHSLTRYGLEEYVADCVILLDHRVSEQISTRRLRVVKYRGSAHGTNEYPFLIDEQGISVLPITSLGLEPCGLHGAHLHGRPAAGRDAGRQGLLPRQQRPGLGHGGHGQDQPGGAFRRRRLPARRAVPVLCLRGVREPDHPQHALHRHRPGAHGSGRAC